MIPVKLNYEILDSRELFSINTAGTNTAYGLGVDLCVQAQLQSQIWITDVSSSQCFG